MSLRSKLIRLAHTHPEFRKDILPLLKSGSKTLDLEQIRKAESIISDLKGLSAKCQKDAESVKAYHQALRTTGILATNNVDTYTKVIVDRFDDIVTLCNNYVEYLEKQLQNPIQKGLLRNGPTK